MTSCFKANFNNFKYFINYFKKGFEDFIINYFRITNCFILVNYFNEKGFKDFIINYFRITHYFSCFILANF